MLELMITGLSYVALAMPVLVPAWWFWRLRANNELIRSIATPSEASALPPYTEAQTPSGEQAS
jgi:hypothetical protein